jgi:hypothetical protein
LQVIGGPIVEQTEMAKKCMHIRCGDGVKIFGARTEPADVKSSPIPVFVIPAGPDENNSVIGCRWQCY